MTAPALPLLGRPVAAGAQATALLDPPDRYRDAFRHHRALLCPDLLEPTLLAGLLDRCAHGSYAIEQLEQFGAREYEAPQRVGSALNILLSRAPLLRWVEAATGTEGLVAVEGRVANTRANGTDQLVWHNDMDVGPRRLGITLNLSDQPYEGGDFELRSLPDRTPLAAYRHRDPGTALIFDIGYDLEHRVRPVSSGGPRRVFTGWFLQADA